MQTGTAYFWPACQSLNFLREYIDNVYTNSPITTLPNGLLLSVDGRHRPMFKFCLLKRLLFSRFFHSIACCLSSSHLAAPWLTSLLTSNSILTIIHHFCCRGRALAEGDSPLEEEEEEEGDSRLERRTGWGGAGAVLLRIRYD